MEATAGMRSCHNGTGDLSNLASAMIGCYRFRRYGFVPNSCQRNVSGHSNLHALGRMNYPINRGPYLNLRKRISK